MPGTLTLRPLTANLTRDTEFFGTMDPYCKVILGRQKLDGQVCRNGGKHPSWDDAIVLRRVDEHHCHIEVKEKDWLLPDSIIGACDVNLMEVESQKRVLKWYPLSFENKPVGKILLEINYEPDHQAFLKDALPVNNANKNVLGERVNQPVKPSEEQPAKKGFLQGIIHGWTPFGSKEQQKPESDIKHELKPVVIYQPVQTAPPKENASPFQEVNNKYPLNTNDMNHYDQQTYAEQNRIYQESQRMHHHAQQQENDYPQKYPQFSPQQSVNIDSNYQGGNYPNVNQGYVQQVAGDHFVDNRDYSGMRERDASGAGQYLNEYYSGDNVAQNSQDDNINKFDPLRVIRGL